MSRCKMPEILTGGAPPEVPPPRPPLRLVLSFFGELEERGSTSSEPVALAPCLGGIGTATDEEAGTTSLEGPLSLLAGADSFSFALSLFVFLSRPPTPLKAASNWRDARPMTGRLRRAGASEGAAVASSTVAFWLGLLDWFLETLGARVLGALTDLVASVTVLSTALLGIEPESVADVPSDALDA